jgi:hypothetical protein
VSLGALQCCSGPSQSASQYLSNSGASFTVFPLSPALALGTALTAQSSLPVGATAADNVGGFCFQLATSAWRPPEEQPLALDDVQVVATSCAPGYFNSNGACAACPGASVCAGGTIVGLLCPPSSACASPCTPGCLPAACRCRQAAHRQSNGAWLEPPHQRGRCVRYHAARRARWWQGGALIAGR